MQLHLQRAMHFLQSESLGLPPPQSHLLTHLSLELPPHKHRAMHRRTGTHDGHPNFIWFTTQLLHSRPSFGQASPAGNKSSSSISGTRARVVQGLFSIMFFWNQSSLKKCFVRLGCLIYILVQQNTVNTLKCDQGLQLSWSPSDRDPTVIQFLLLLSLYEPPHLLPLNAMSWFAQRFNLFAFLNVCFSRMHHFIIRGWSPATLATMVKVIVILYMWLYTTGVEKYG